MPKRAARAVGVYLFGGLEGFNIDFLCPLFGLCLMSRSMEGGDTLGDGAGLGDRRGLGDGAGLGDGKGLGEGLGGGDGGGEGGAEGRGEGRGEGGGLGAGEIKAESEGEGDGLTLGLIDGDGPGLGIIEAERAFEGGLGAGEISNSLRALSGEGFEMIVSVNRPGPTEIDLGCLAARGIQSSSMPAFNSALV